MGNLYVTFETNQGSIEFKLFPEIAPKACENFATHAEKGYYNGVIFHRVIKEFMIQGGDPDGTGMGGKSIWGKPFEDECVREVSFNRPGILAMANAGPRTNGSQFFITCAATPWLNMRHTIFGEVVKGMEVVSALEAVETGRQDRPVEKQHIVSASVRREA
jgi:peptidylprolyl isomerase